MKNFVFILLLGLSLHVGPSISTFTSSDDAPLYDYSASTECKSTPEAPLYNGGIIKNQALETPINSTAFVLNNLTGDTIYSFSGWIKITGAASSLIKATLTTDNVIFNCTGTNSDGQQINVSISSASLQPFTNEQWNNIQQNTINTERKRTATLHVSDVNGNSLHGAKVVVEQVSRDFPLGSAISEGILGNLPYQKWFVDRFNAAVFENELKWNSTEPQRGQINYTIPDQMLQFLHSKNIHTIRGHNILWESHNVIPAWAKNLTTSELNISVRSRIHSLLNRYKNQFVHWDVDNEMLPWDFFKQRLGPNASLEFFRTAQRLDPLATMFMNEFNVLENCNLDCAVDNYVERLKWLREGGVTMAGIGLQAHFFVPNPALIRGVLDKLATLKLPIWLTELDISKKLDPQTQAKYLEVALREAFSHPSVDGIMMWTALHPNGDGCYRMCLTDYNFKNLPTGDVVDSLLKEWQTGVVEGETDGHGIFNFSGFLGEYKVTITYKNRTTNSTLYLSRGHETKHLNIHL
ncbi:hypothetical protein DH2020_006890 [Rehmannia glutinosa]|uniref:GH10 domain-containing protein n=1 Tax=Rehmannia glutinosa TaxID=99300 RepID=A0ABR0XK92_REHGL